MLEEEEKEIMNLLELLERGKVDKSIVVEGVNGIATQLYLLQFPERDRNFFI
jgi:hypothetical protein